MKNCFSTQPPLTSGPVGPTVSNSTQDDPPSSDTSTTKMSCSGAFPNVLENHREYLMTDGPDEPLLPHPRMHQRAFVLLPLAEIAPEWRHPVTGEPIDRLIAALPPDQTATLVE